MGHSKALLSAVHALSEGRRAQARSGFEAVLAQGGEEAAKAVRFLAHLDMGERRYLEAAQRLQAFTEQFGPDAGVLAQWAEACMAVGDLEQALQHARASLALQPDNAVMRLNQASWEGGRSHEPLRVRQLHEAWCQRHLRSTGVPQDAAPLRARRGTDATSRLRVGYLSGDLNNHAVRYFIEPCFALHDRERIEVHAFMTGATDAISDILRAKVEHWHDVARQSDEELFALIRRLGIDVLVDLSGHTDGQRLQVFAWRAAPVQVTWWGYVQTLGLQQMDWRLCDAATCPPGTDAHYTERLWRLQALTAYQPPVDSEQVFDSPFKANGYVTLACVNHSRKVGQEALGLWQRVLQACPGAALLIVANESTAEGAQALFEPRLRQQGLPMDRVAVVPRLSMREFMRMASVADLALDSLPVSGGVTTFHCLWMGLPVIALRPPQPMAVQSYACDILQTLGLQECIAHGEDDYVARLKALIDAPRQIETLRAATHKAIRESPYLDHAARVRELEAAFLAMAAAAAAEDAADGADAADAAQA